MVVTDVEKLEPLSLRKEWMNDLAQAVTLLESLNLAHSDLRPGNIPLYRDRLKPSDFDCTAGFGTDFEACIAPYGRVLNSNGTERISLRRRHFVRIWRSVGSLTCSLRMSQSSWGSVTSGIGTVSVVEPVNKHPWDIS